MKMKLQKLLILFISLTISGLAIGQTYNIVIKGGHVIDPKNNINAVMDVAVKDGKIAMVAKNIDAREGRQEIGRASCRERV